MSRSWRGRPGARFVVVALAFGVGAVAGCGDPAAPPGYVWQAVHTDLPGALLSVWGSSERDVWAVGSDARDGTGPMALRYDGATWRRVDTGLHGGDLWWVYGPSPEAVFLVGSGGAVVRHDRASGAFARMATPSAAPTLFGVWGASASDVWAVGGDLAPDATVRGVVWHYDGTAWTNTPIPAEAASRALIYKVWGSAANDVWAVGELGTTLHWDGRAWSLVPVPAAGRGQRLFTVHGRGAERYAVGGLGSGVILEGDGATGWRPAPLAPALDPLRDGAMSRLNGVFAPPPGSTASPLAVGANGVVLQRRDGAWREVARPITMEHDFHSVWVDPTGAVWAVGGQIAATPLHGGMLYRFGLPIPARDVVTDPSLTRCPDTRGTICTWAGTAVAGFNGDGRPLRESSMYWPVDMEFDRTGRGYVLDWNNHRVRRVTDQGTFETIVGTPVPGDGPEDESDLREPGAMGPTVALNHPTDLLFPADGRMLIVAWHNHKMRRWDPATGRVVVTMGRGPGYVGDGMPVSNMALLKQPSHAALDAQGNLYILDQGNLRVRRVGADGMMSLVAGDGMRGYGGDDGPPAMARFNFQVGENPEPEGGIAIDASGRLYISDTGNHRIRRIDLAANRIETIAGTGTAGFSGDDGPARMAQLHRPLDLEFGPDGRLYFADANNHRVRAIDLATGVITTVAGTGRPGFAGDRGAAVAAELFKPYGVAFDPRGDLYIVDTFNNRIRRVVMR